jgi:drug/metabolite transporter (DMT)-like permease
MRIDDSAIAPSPQSLSTRSALVRGSAWGLLGVAIFSFSFPATRLAVEGLDPWVVGLGRAVVAAVLAAAFLGLTRAPRPHRAHWPRLAVVAGGVVVGFPVLTALALRDVPSAHGAIVIGVLPAATAVWAVLRAGERPGPAFWAAGAAGFAAVVIFAATRGAGGLHVADLELLAGVVLCGLGYAEGGALARELGGPQVICWALLLSAPVLVPVVAVVALGGADLDAPAQAWLGFAYVALFSMFLGFFAWYRGLALGGVARVGQVQLAQPVMTLGWSAMLLGEAVGPATLVAAAAVLACVAGTQRARAAVPARPHGAGVAGPLADGAP